jgi:hypothetical protein
MFKVTIKNSFPLGTFYYFTTFGSTSSMKGRRSKKEKTKKKN